MGGYLKSKTLNLELKDDPDTNLEAYHYEGLPEKYYICISGNYKRWLISYDRSGLTVYGKMREDYPPNFGFNNRELSEYVEKLSEDELEEAMYQSFKIDSLRPMKSTKLDAPSLASIGTFLSNSEGNVLHNISADLRSQGRLELEARLTKMKRLQNLQWGSIVNDPQQRYIIGDKREGELLGKTFLEREHFLNSIGVKTLELTSEEEGIVKSAIESIGEKITPLTDAERIEMYPDACDELREEKMELLTVELKVNDFVTFLKAWIRDDQRCNLLECIRGKLFEAMGAGPINEHIRENEQLEHTLFLMIYSIFLKDFHTHNPDKISVDAWRGSDDDNYMNPFSTIEVAMLLALNIDFFKERDLHGYVSTLMYHYLHTPTERMPYLSIITNHLGEDISGFSEDFTKSGSFHLIPLLIQGNGLSNLSFTAVIANVKRMERRFDGDYGYIPTSYQRWSKFINLFGLIVYLMKRYNFTDADILKEMKSYVKNPRVSANSGMRDSLWRNAYLMSKGYSSISHDELRDIVLPWYDNNSGGSIFTGLDFIPDPDEVDDDDNMIEQHPPATFIQVDE